VLNGRVRWYGVVEAEPFLEGHTQVAIGSKAQRAVLFPISRKLADHGRSRINWVTVLAQEFVSSGGEEPDSNVFKDRLLDPFRNWKFDSIDIADLIGRTRDIHPSPERDRDPLPQWSFGRVTLLGDAAHPMRPTGAQAGSQAIVDARVLAHELATTPDPDVALAQYDAHRRPAMN